MSRLLAFKLLEKHEMAWRSMRGIDPGVAMGRSGCGTRADRQRGALTQLGAGEVSIPQEAFIAALRMGDES